MFSGPTATIENTPPLVTSNQARRRHGLAELVDAAGRPLVDVLRAQRLAAPAVVYAVAHSAHPLEADAAELCASPDGVLDDAGHFHPWVEPASGGEPIRGIPVYRIELDPADGLLPLPYMGRRADGRPWEPGDTERQTFYPDASRLYEEIDRLCIAADGRSAALTALAEFDFIRAAPSGGYVSGAGAVDGLPELRGVDFFPYGTGPAASEPGLAALAVTTNVVQATLDTGRYVGAQWLEGSPTIEETAYWLNLVIDTDRAIVAHAAQRPHQAIGDDGAANIAAGVRFVLSGAGLDRRGRNRLGVVVVVDGVAYAAREVVKTDARPGGFGVIGGQGGVVADLGDVGKPVVMFLPHRRHGWRSDVRLTRLPRTVLGVTGGTGRRPRQVDVEVTDGERSLRPEAMPVVAIVGFGRYIDSAGTGDGRNALAVAIDALVEHHLSAHPLAGVVVEGLVPHGYVDGDAIAALERAVGAGMPVVCVGRGGHGGRARPFHDRFVAGDNLSAAKARMLLMAGLLRYGAIPPAPVEGADSDRWRTRARRAVERYQRLFDTH